MQLFIYLLPIIVSFILIIFFPHISYEILYYFFGIALKSDANNVLILSSETMTWLDIVYYFLCSFFLLVILFHSFLYFKNKTNKFNKAAFIYLLIPVILYGWVLGKSFNSNMLAVSMTLLAYKNDLKRVPRLSYLGANPNILAKTEQEKYPMQYPLTMAAGMGHKDMVLLLLSLGADPLLKNSEGKTSIDIAVERNQNEIKDILVNWNKDKISGN